MIEVIRIVEHQASLSSYRATQDEEAAVQLELLIESTKPKNTFLEWHTLIATPFRYAPPHPHARFRPTFGKNIFYGSLIKETAFYEHAFHYMKQRMHLDIQSETGTRTLFSVDANDDNSVSIRKEPELLSIMNKNDYSVSHKFLEQHPEITFLLYPSCRDPKQRDNAAILNIQHLAKSLKWEKSINFFYDNQKKQLTWIDDQFHIQWGEVA